MTEATAPRGGRTQWQRVARRVRVPLGFVVAAVFLLSAQPTGLTLLLSLPLVLAGLGLRAYAAGYVRKNAELTRTGPYAYTRNPLYLGSMLIAFGFAFGAARVWLFLLLAVLFALIYAPTIRSEESFLQAAFPEFEDYARQVPRLFPRFSAARFNSVANEAGTPLRRFSPERYWRHREYNAGMGAAVIYAALLMRLLLRGRA